MILNIEYEGSLEGMSGTEDDNADGLDSQAAWFSMPSRVKRPCEPMLGPDVLLRILVSFVNRENESGDTNLNHFN
jgi:hypothetical protein